MLKAIAGLGLVWFGVCPLMADEPNIRVDGAWMRAVPPSTPRDELQSYLLLDEGDAIGNIKRHSWRLWPQTETIRVLCREASSGKAWPNLFSEITERLFRAHQSADLNGGRIDQVDGNGTDRVDYMPANTLCVSKAVWMVPAWSRSRRHERRPTGTSIPIETVYSGGLQ